MSDTHPNAYRTEADEKRAQAQVLINEANELEAKASAVARENVDAESEEQAEKPVETEASEAKEAPADSEKSEKSGGKLFGKKQ
jgi:hypothetical protein